MTKLTDIITDYRDAIIQLRETQPLVESVFYPPTTRMRMVNDYLPDRMKAKNNPDEFKAGQVLCSDLTAEQRNNLYATAHTKNLHMVYNDRYGNAVCWIFKNYLDDQYKVMSRAADYMALVMQPANTKRTGWLPIMPYQVAHTALSYMMQEAVKTGEHAKVEKAFPQHQESLVHIAHTERNLITIAIDQSDHKNTLAPAWEAHVATVEILKL